MIEYKEYKFKTYDRESYEATIISVEAEDNMYFDPERENSTPTVLSITFDIVEPVGDNSEFTQKYVAPLTGKKSLFYQICTACGIDLKKEGKLDEQNLVGKKLNLVFGQNKKGFNQIVSAFPSTNISQPEKEEQEEDLPEFLKD